MDQSFINYFYFLLLWLFCFVPIKPSSYFVKVPIIRITVSVVYVPLDVDMRKKRREKSPALDGKENLHPRDLESLVVIRYIG